MPYTRFSRRTWLKAAGLTPVFRSLVADAAGLPAKRLLVIHRPCGVIAKDYFPAGPGGTSFALSPILNVFAPLQSQMVVFEGMNTPPSNCPDLHGDGLLSFMTGGKFVLPAGQMLNANGINPNPPPGPYMTDLPSIDQILVKDSPILKGMPFPSLQLGVDLRNGSVYRDTMSYAVTSSGPAMPLKPVIDPVAVYDRVFSALMAPGGAPPSGPSPLVVRAQKQSVLDFLKKDLGRLQKQTPAGQRPKLDAITSAIRELEQALALYAPMPMLSASCQKPAAPAAMMLNRDATHAAVGQLMQTFIRTAFLCDLTRVITFTWATGNSPVNFNNVPPSVRIGHHHDESHKANSAPGLTEVEKWYAARTFELLQALKATPEGNGTMLDNTLVVYFSEVGYGLTHSRQNVPVALFGGAGVGLRGGQYIRLGGRWSPDLWTAVARQFGVNLPTFGIAANNSAPLTGVFA